MDYVTFDRLCKANGTTATALAVKLGLSKGNTTSWKKGGNPSAEILIRIADELNCTVDVLLGRKNFQFLYDNEDENALHSAFVKLDAKDKAKVIERAETLAELAAERAAEQAKKTAKPDELAADEQPSELQTYSITYFDYAASAGTGLFLDETTGEELFVVRTPEALRADFAIPIKGDSMEPDFSSGDVVLVESCPCVSRGEIGIFVLDGEAFIKEFGGNCLISRNPEYAPKMLTEFTRMVCLGRVLGKAEIIK